MNAKETEKLNKSHPELSAGAPAPGPGSAQDPTRGTPPRRVQEGDVVIFMAFGYNAERKIPQQTRYCLDNPRHKTRVAIVTQVHDERTVDLMVVVGAAWQPVLKVYFDGHKERPLSMSWHFQESRD